MTVQGGQLSGLCDGQTSSKIYEITRRIQQQWTIIEQRLQEIIKPSREVIDCWRKFNNLHVHLLDRLGELETRWYTVQQEKFTLDIDSLFDKSKVNIRRKTNRLSVFHKVYFRIFSNVLNS